MNKLKYLPSERYLSIGDKIEKYKEIRDFFIKEAKEFHLQTRGWKEQLEKK